MKKTILAIIAALMLGRALWNGNYTSLLSWSEPEAIGFNVGQLILIFGGLLFLYLAFRKPKHPKK